MAMTVSTAPPALHKGSEIFLMGMMFKNILLYSFAYFITDRLAMRGPQAVSYTLGATAFGVWLDC
jgi:hypothetical protein